MELPVHRILKEELNKMAGLVLGSSTGSKLLPAMNEEAGRLANQTTFMPIFFPV